MRRPLGEADRLYDRSPLVVKGNRPPATNRPPARDRERTQTMSRSRNVARHPVHHRSEQHRSQRAGWLRAAVLGANDGLLSTASLVLGVAAADVSRSVLWLSGLASMAAGAFSMAAGEYTSVSSQRDAEVADLRAEAAELQAYPEAEVRELTDIYRRRGLSPGLARRVADELHRTDALGAHARDELGLDPNALAAPLQAALVSFTSFGLGALVPVLTIALLPSAARMVVTAAVTLVALAVLGATAARLGGAPTRRAAVRLLVLGALAMAVTSAIGRLVGVTV
jgi:VIT1/CCC1 family predicted Fe2+/Mn2+ transporter